MTHTYVLGHTGVEVQRLLRQGELYNEFRAEALAANAVITMPPIITAWAQLHK